MTGAVHDRAIVRRAKRCPPSGLPVASWDQPSRALRLRCPLTVRSPESTTGCSFYDENQHCDTKGRLVAGTQANNIHRASRHSSPSYYLHSRLCSPHSSCATPSRRPPQPPFLPCPPRLYLYASSIFPSRPFLQSSSLVTGRREKRIERGLPWGGCRGPRR